MNASEKNLHSSLIVLPLPPTASHEDAFAMDVYARFMRQLRYVPTSRADIQILSCIQFVADMMDIPDDDVTKVLVDLGLRAPRTAFPLSYLDCVDRFSVRCGPAVYDSAGLTRN